MIRTSASIALAAVALSAAAHLGGVAAGWSPDDAMIEGSAPSNVSRLGNSFRDVAMGEQTAQDAEDMVEDVEPTEVVEPIEVETEAEPTEVAETPETVEPEDIEPVELTDQQQPVQTQTQTPAPEAPLVTPQTLASRPTIPVAPRAMLTPTLPRAVQRPQAEQQVIRQSQVTPTPITSQTTDAVPQPQQLAALTPTTPQALPKSETAETDPAPPPPNVLTALPQENETAPILSRRPALRPETLEIPETATRTQPSSPKPEQPSRRGADNTEVAGTSQGSKSSNARVASQNTGRVSRDAGNAAITNYLGRVYRKIQRRSPRTNIRGEAVVVFTIAPNGALSQLRLGRSSGSATLDQQALNSVRRAAPFPATPDGNTMRLNITIQGR